MMDHFSDPDNDSLTFGCTVPDNMEVDINQDEIVVFALEGFYGDRQMTFYASDGINSTPSNEITVTIEPLPFEGPEELIQLPAEIGKPVKWIKRVKLDKETTNPVISVPFLATNLKGSKSLPDRADISHRIREAVPGLGHAPALQAAPSTPDALANRTKPVIIEDTLEQFEIEYETPAPEKTEERISSLRKRITVHSGFHYENVYAYTELETEVSPETVTLYYVDNKRDDGKEARYRAKEAFYNDTNGNGLIDRIEWNIPHLSNQTYEVEIDILNVQSYPTLYGNWTVNFTTTGTADLTITASNGTTWADNDNSSGTDLSFLEVRCGDTVQSYEWTDNTVLIEDYCCNGTGHEVSQVLTEGEHTLRFQFGDDIEYAKNYVFSPQGVYWMYNQDNKSWEGNDTSYAGVTLEWADLNNDSYSDAIVGAPFATVDGNMYRGAVYILYGPLEDITDVDIWTQADVIISGREGGGDPLFMGSCLGAGDLDDDGYEDLIVGATYWGGEAFAQGQLHIIYGQEEKLSSGYMDEVADANISGNYSAMIGDGFNFGSYCDAVDVNGDDHNDIIVSEDEIDWNSCGKTYLVMSDPSSRFSGDQNIVDIYNESWEGTDPYAAGGAHCYYIRKAGDVNGDGYEDFLIGCPQMWPVIENSQGGAVFLIYGQAGAWDQKNFTLPHYGPWPGTNATFTALGSGNDPWFGHDVSAAGDVNNDTFDDFMISASLYDPWIQDEGEVKTDAGRVWLFLGGPGLPWATTGTNVIDVDASGKFNYNASFNGTILSNTPDGLGEPFNFALSGQYFGHALGYGDFNKDNYSDILMGAPHADNLFAEELDAGYVSMFYGREDNFSTRDYYSFMFGTGDIFANATFYADSMSVGGPEDWFGTVPTGMAEGVLVEDIMMGSANYNHGGVSCPFLYTWNGEEYEFQADIFSAGKLGIPTKSGPAPPSPNDHLLIRKENMAAENGTFSIRMVEERDEMSYVDRARLYVVEHPSDMEIIPDTSSMLDDVPELRLHKIDSTAIMPISCVTDTGEDCLEAVSDMDYDQAILGRQEYPEWHYIELDFGEIEEDDLELVFRANSEFPWTPEGSARKKAFSKVSEIEVYNGTGWEVAPQKLPLPKDIPRDHAIDITGISPDSHYKLRLKWVHRTLVNYVKIALAVDEPVSIVELNLTSADLGYHGLSYKDHRGSVLSPIYDWTFPVLFYYDYYPGNYTRYGDVLPLLTENDDKFVIMEVGSEVSMEFDDYAPEGDYDFIFYSYGYYKDRKSDRIYGTGPVEPYPFQEMSTYPYNTSVESYPDDEEHNAYKAEYNTRYLEPYEGVFEWNGDFRDHHSNEGKVFVMNGNNDPPTHDRPVLNSTGTGLARINENLTLWNMSTYDKNGDTVNNIVVWHKDGRSWPILYMPFDDPVVTNSTGEIKDYSSFMNNGTLGGGTYAYRPTYRTDGVLGGCYRFDGVNDYINVSDSDIFSRTENTNNMTVEFWMKADSLIDWSKPVAKYNWVGYSVGTFFVDITNLDYMRFEVYDDTLNGYATGTSTSPLKTGHWYYVVGVVNGTHVSLYLDGVLNSSSSYNGNPIYNSDSDLMIGANFCSGSPCGFFNGSIDELRIYDTALSPEQIAANYNGSEPNYRTITSQHLEEGDVW